MSDNGFLSKITETDMFDRINCLITDKRRKELEKIKTKLSLVSNIKIDNSTFLRGIIDYYKDNDEQLEELKDYMIKNKGKVMFDKFEKLIKNNANNEEIYEQIGLDEEKIKELKNK